MDPQFLNVDCHPSALQRPVLHPSYPTGPTGGTYSLDVHQPSEGIPLVNQFNPYRQPASSDSSGHASLASSQFSAFDSFYKAYQSAYGQNSTLAGVMFGHPSYRFDGPLLPHDRQLPLPTGFLHYPPLFPNSSLYASLPGSSGNPRYPPDYFGRNLSGLSSFSNASEFASDLGPTRPWSGLERTSNILDAFVAPSVSSESSKDDRHGNDRSAKKVGDGDRYEPGAGFPDRSGHRPGASGRPKVDGRGEETSDDTLGRRLLSSTSSTLRNDGRRETSQRRGNGETACLSRRQDYSYANEKAEFAAQSSGKDSSFQKRGVLASPQTLSKSTSFPVVANFPEAGDGPSSFARHGSDYLLNHYASKMYPPVSFSSELLSLQSRTALGSTIYRQQNACLQRSDDKPRREVASKPAKSEDGSNSKNCTSFLSGSKRLPPDNRPPEKTFEQKFHRPFELLPMKPVTVDENRHSAAENTSAPSQKVRKSTVKTMMLDEKVERTGSFLKKAHHQTTSNRLQHFLKSENSTSHVDGNEATTESFVASVPSWSNSFGTNPSREIKIARAGDETASVREDGKTSDSKKSPRIRFSASKIDAEEAWRSGLRDGKVSKEVDRNVSSRAEDCKFEESYDDYDYECERKVARLTTVVSATPLSPSNNSQEKIDFLSSLGLSTIEKCKELEFEKRRRRKRQLRDRSVSPTSLKDEEPMAGGSFGCCTSDCPHKNGVDKGAMLAMLGLHQVEMCQDKDDKYYEEGGTCQQTDDSSYRGVSTSYSHHFSYPPPLTSLYSFPNQYPSSHLSTSVYSFYPPGYVIDQPSSASSSSSSSSSSSTTASSSNSPYCRFYGNPHVTSSKGTLSYPYQSSLASCFDGQQVYYQQGKDERIHSKVGRSSSNEVVDFGGYEDVYDRNLLDSSELASVSRATADRCVSSTPANRRRNAGDLLLQPPAENGLPKGSDPSLFHWPGVDSVVEAYHHYIEERAMEKQLLLEHATKLNKSNSELLNTSEQLKDKISDLRKSKTGLEGDRSSTQSQLEVLKNFILQLK